MNGSTVHITVPAASAYAVVARTAAASVAAGIGATVEGVEDLRIVASEAFTLALATVPVEHDSAVHAGIAFALTASDGAIELQVIAPASPDFQIDRNSFSWTILDALLSDLSGSIEPTADGHALRIAGRARLHVPA